MIKFITRKDGLIKNIFNRPNKNTEKIDTDCKEFKDYENKTGLYEVKKTYVENRLEAYGDASEQLEFIVENGIEAFIERQNSIKAQFPK